VKNSKRVAIIITAPFPTPRAYGVTTRETVQTLTELGYENRVFCVRSNFIDFDFAKILENITFFPDNLFSRLTFRFSKLGNHWIFLISWRIFVIYSFLLSLKDIKVYAPRYLWMRDPIAVYISRIFFPDQLIVFEIHDFSSYFFLKKIIKKPNNTKIFPINIEINTKIKNINSEISTCLAPMGIKNCNIVSEKSVDLFIDQLTKKSKLDIKIGYVGNMAPSGYSKGIEDLINLGKFYKDQNEGSQIKLIGAYPDELIALEKMRMSLGIGTHFLQIEAHVDHSEALLKLKEFDVLVLPISANKNYVGMPLKLFEYIASGRIVVVANCKLYKSFFNENYTPYWYESKNINSLHTSINYALGDLNLRKHLISGLEFVKEFTWEKRTLNMML